MSKHAQPVIFGEVLYDCFPDGNRVLGGAPFNVAWHCQAFGLQPLFISRVGDDDLGKQIISAMKTWGMDITGVQIDKKHPTGIVDVKFDNGQPSYDIVYNSAWDFIDQKELPDLEEAGLLYHGSLALRNTFSNSAFVYIKNSFRLPSFVDINLRSPWWQAEELVQIVSSADWLKLNDEELELIMPGDMAVEKKMQRLLSDNALQMLVVTLGEQGVLALDQQGNQYRVKPKMTSQVVDTVGAGDSFSSVLLLGRSLSWPLQLTLERAQQFASAIVGIQGATIDDMAFYQPFIDEWQLSLS